MMCVIFVLLSIEFVSTLTKNDILYIKDGKCLKYSTVLPDGYCSKYLQNQYVFMNTGRIRRTNADLVFFHLSLRYICKHKEDYTNVSRVFISALSRKCHHPQMLMETSKYVKSMLTGVEKLLPSFMWMLCSLQYPICLDGKESRISLPCKEMYNIFRKIGFVRHIENNWKEYGNLCPNIIDLDSYFNKLEKSNIRYIENCQLFNQTASSRKIKNYTQKCYNDNGLYYDGTQNKAENGKQCINWTSIPALSTYVNLTSNFCRNPQGYGARPWCYTHALTRDWSYCPIKLCHSVYENVRPTSRVVVIIVVVAIVCFVLFLAFIVLFKTKKTSKELIDPYSEYSLTSSQFVVQLLRNEDIT